VATALDIHERLAVVINRANSGVKESDVEQVVALPILGRIRSAGTLFIRAADEGKSAVERFPTAKVVGDIDRLADRLIDGVGPGVSAGPGARWRGRLAGSFRGLFGRRVS
jgi:Flp pilus assembly CpaE family ATPase